MNELNKLLSSLLLLGGGFLAASFVGPPEAVDRLARYLQPDERVAADGLRPLESSLSGASVQRDWPDLPAPQPAATIPPQQQPIAPRSVPQTPGLSASWPAPQAETVSISAAPGGEWLTSETLAPAPTASPAAPKAVNRRLTPIPRDHSGAAPSPVAAPSPSEAPALAEPVWPSLRPPVTSSPPGNTPTPNNEAYTARKPTLQDSPYGSRPQPAVQAAPASDDWPGLGFTPMQRPLERIERPAPAPPAYGDHIVTDGDTLALLADRYLGDASRAGELFELNRDRLDHPDVLPIGMVLKTPPREGLAKAPAPRPAAAPSPSGFATLTAATAGVSQRGPSSVERRLTPIATPTESVRPTTPAQPPLFARDAQWNTGGW